MQNIYCIRPTYLLIANIDPFECLSDDTLLGYGGSNFVHRINDLVVLKTAHKYNAEADNIIPPFFLDDAKHSGENIADEKNWYSLLDATPHPHRLQSFMSTVEGIFLPRMSTNLKDLIIAAKENSISIRAKYRWAKELSAAATSLESLRLAHCDIRPANIFIDCNEQVKLGDFDTLSRYGEAPVLNVAPVWIWYDTCCGPKHDLFGIGNTLWELFTGTEYDWGVPKHPHGIPSTTEVELGDIMSRCWNSSYGSISDLAKETEARYFGVTYGVFASIVRKTPYLSTLLGEKTARVLDETQLAHGRATIEKFLIDQDVVYSKKTIATKCRIR